jgi:hypothetical protein
VRLALSLPLFPSDTIIPEADTAAEDEHWA